MSSFLDGLNKNQKKAVLTTEGPLLILAGAGSGKTRVLTHRIAYLIQHGISPYNILAITFTNKAAKEMKERVSNIIGENNQVWISTFHSTCVRILRREIEILGYDNSFTIYDTDDSAKLLKICLKELNLNEKLFPIRSVINKIGSFKDSLLSTTIIARDAESDFKLQKYSEIYSLYQKKLFENNALDFDDIIFKTVEIFHYHKNILEKYQNRFYYIMVDEYQDTNTAQYTLIKFLAEKYKNLCVVGDDDQSIYGWRGANIQNILDFEKDFENTTVIKLEQNYRSTQNILDVANFVIQNNSNRKNKSLWTESEKGKEIKLFNASTDFEEGIFISNIINDKVKNNKNNYSDFAILYRTNAQSRIIEDNLVRNNIPYRLIGGLRFYERKEIKDILSYLQVIFNFKDGIAFRRIINTPRRGIGNTTIDRINIYALENEISFYTALKNINLITTINSRAKNLVTDFINLIDDFIEASKILNISDLLKKILNESGYLESLDKNDEEDLKRLENIYEFQNKSLEFEAHSEDKSLQSFLEEISLVADIDNYDENKNTVVLMTIHSSKGLEFPTVFISGMEENIFPSYRSIFSDSSIDELEEERRLCYVAITRAKKSLYMIHANSRRQFGEMTYNKPSRFIQEIPENYIKKVDLNLVSNYKPSNSIKNNFNIQNNYNNNISVPKNVVLDFEVDDFVKHFKYGVGKVLAINPAGADYEVTLDFLDLGRKKFMAKLSKLKKIK